jgi:hypothetical protein
MIEEKNAAVRPYPGESINAKRLGQTSFASGGAFSSWLPTLSTSVFWFFWISTTTTPPRVSTLAILLSSTRLANCSNWSLEPFSFMLRFLWQAYASVALDFTTNKKKALIVPQAG